MTVRHSLAKWNWAHLTLLLLLPASWWIAVQAQLPSAPWMLTWVALCVAMFAVAERYWPFRQDWQPSARQWKRDGSVFSLNVLTDGVATAAMAALAMIWAPTPSDTGIGAQILLGAVLAELGGYLLHRWSHGARWLWRVHLLHHRPERLNTPNAFTVHPLNVLLDKFARVLPQLALGLSPQAMLGIAMFGILQAIAAHANVRGTLGPLNWLIGSAELHRLHHSTDPRQAGNYGTALPLWDQVFGTYRRGAAPARVGVFEPTRYPDEYALRALLAWPFLGSAGAWARMRCRWLERCCR